MSTKSKVIVSGVLATVIAIALIGAVVFTPGVINTKSTSSTSVSTGTTSTSNSGVSTSSQSSTTSSSSSQESSGGSGTLAVMLTDPPTVPDGVTNVYINYSDIEVHFADAGNQTGWTELQSSGSIDLMSVLNESQTIAATNITSGKFNGLRFNVTSAVVTFEGTNYTADLVYQEHTLYVWIPGGIYVANGQTSGAMIDLSPTVLLLGNTTDPTFAFIPAATGYTLPANSIPNHPYIGWRKSWGTGGNGIPSAIWWMTRFQLTSASLTPNSLGVTVDNTGNATIIFHFLALTATSTPSGGWVPSSPIGPASRISEFFVIAPNGTLIPLTASTWRGTAQTLALAGYALAPGTSAIFTYSGPVTLGAFELLQGHTPTQQVVVGQRYIATVLGGGQHAQTEVTATGAVVATSSTSTPTSTETTTVTVTSTPTTSTTSQTTSSSSSTSTSSTSTTTSSTTSTTSSTSSTSSTTSSSTSTSTTTPTETSTSTTTSGD